MKRADPAFQQFSFLPVLVAGFLLFGLTGCYTQLVTVEHTASEREGRVQERAVEQRHMDEYDLARHIYEERYYSRISYNEYRTRMLDLYFQYPHGLNLGMLLHVDPAFSPYIPHARFITYVRFRGSFFHDPYYSGFYASYGWWTRPHVVHDYWFRAQFRNPYWRGRYYHHRPSFAYAPGRYYSGYRWDGPYAIQRGSTFGAASSTAARGRVVARGTDRVVVNRGSTQQNGRVGTAGRVSSSGNTSADQVRRSDSASTGRAATPGRAAATADDGRISTQTRAGTTTRSDATRNERTRRTVTSPSDSASRATTTRQVPQRLRLPDVRTQRRAATPRQTTDRSRTSGERGTVTPRGTDRSRSVDRSTTRTSNPRSTRSTTRSNSGSARSGRSSSTRSSSGNSSRTGRSSGSSTRSSSGSRGSSSGSRNSRNRSGNNN